MSLNSALTFTQFLFKVNQGQFPRATSIKCLGQGYSGSWDSKHTYQNQQVVRYLNLYSTTIHTQCVKYDFEMWGNLVWSFCYPPGLASCQQPQVTVHVLLNFSNVLTNVHFLNYRIYRIFKLLYRICRQPKRLHVSKRNEELDSPHVCYPAFSMQHSVCWKVNSIKKTNKFCEVQCKCLH